MNWLTRIFQPKKQQQAKLIADLVVEKTNQLLQEMRMEINHRFKEVQSQLHQIDTNVELLEKKIQIKESQDRMEYGRLHYKMNEVENKKLSREVSGIKMKISQIMNEEN